MKNNWIDPSDLTDRQRGLLTLITDKVVQTGTSMGANSNRNWHTQKYYKDYLGEQSAKMQGVLDRIGKVIYHRCFHTVDARFSTPLDQVKYIGEDVYDHSMRFEWCELIGKGTPDSEMSEIGKMCNLQDAVGNWHYPCDTGMWITLWHPSSQSFQETVCGAWLIKGRPYWRPRYHYTDIEVKEALKIMCEAFNWEFAETGDSWIVST